MNPEKKKNFRFETLQLHAGYEPDAATHSRAVPIYASTSFTFKNSEHAANVFNGKDEGFVYSRYLL
jgi:O-acetylhomoserine/O-acetylserine sulfhydrylase